MALQELDTTITNAYKIAHCTPERPNAEPWEHLSHKKFRTRLASQLFFHSERLGAPFQSREGLSKHVHPARESDHGFAIRMKTSKACIASLCAGRICRDSSTRKPLAGLSTNSIRAQKRRERAPRSSFGCGLCGIYLCNKKRCWKEHIEAIASQ